MIPTPGRFFRRALPVPPKFLFEKWHSLPANFRLIAAGSAAPQTRLISAKSFSLNPPNSRVLVVLGPKTLLDPQPQRRFDLAKLLTLEPGRAMEQLAELEKVERGHRLEHVDLVIKQFPDLDDPLQAMDDDVHVRSVVIRGRFAQHFAAGRDLVQDLFEPKLVGLVDDDEEHLVMRDQLSLAAG